MLMKFIKRIMQASRFVANGKNSQKKEVIRATETTLKKYSKTFKDLASYDRGEKKYSLPR